ncbi:MAG TPA: 3-deoxy-7-phosphoheptulonate synthase class II [Streptosporangiaceae bacterium]|nr:3-deoxy-7-phosphoheptulonate synthase class II [Streptosporangiaceae bacterium]
MNLDAYPAAQQPAWPDRGQLTAVLGDLATYPQLVTAAGCDQLRDRMAEVTRGEAFLLQGGDCAETFDGFSARSVHGKLRTLLQMAVVITLGGALPVVKVGRLAGQFAKPRSRPTETRNGVTLPVYRGDSVNGLEFTAQARNPSPERLRRAYEYSLATLGLVRDFAAGSDVMPDLLRAWSEEFLAHPAADPLSDSLAADIGKALDFICSCGVTQETFLSNEFYVSHEALLLDYEIALTRPDFRTGQPYASSGHMVWIGERTRQPDGAHVEFASRIRNPIGVKLGPTATSDDALTLIDRLNPDGEPGRLTFITRMGADKIRDLLPPLIEKILISGAQVAWVCDPMHGNTFESPTGHKTRRFEDVLDEVRGFLEVHQALGTHPGGIQIEFTGDDVTECLGCGVEIADLGKRYESACDPRLNYDQCRELVYHLAEMYRARLRGLEVTRTS